MMFPQRWHINKAIGSPIHLTSGLEPRNGWVHGGSRDKANRAAAFHPQLPIIQGKGSCNFQGYDVNALMRDTAPLRKIVTKRRTIEIIMPL